MRKTTPINTAGAKSLRFLYNTALGRILLKPLVLKPVSTIGGLILSTRLSALFVKRFVKKNRIDMVDYENVKYKSFNDFFTRHIKPDTRPIEKAENSLISPCDAKVTAFNIDENSSFNVKGLTYSVAELLDDGETAKKYLGGYCLIFRLAVDNYHRYCFCADGTVEGTKHIKGKYHTVQSVALSRKLVFKENVREYAVLKTERFGDIVQMEVGALMVGKISNHKGLTSVKKGQEKGYFEFGGSTIILLLEKGKVNIDKEFFENTQNGLETCVKFGEKIGEKTTAY